MLGALLASLESSSVLCIALAYPERVRRGLPPAPAALGPGLPLARVAPEPCGPWNLIICVSR